jgi:hypothetical protein
MHDVAVGGTELDVPAAELRGLGEAGEAELVEVGHLLLLQREARAGGGGCVHDDAAAPDYRGPRAGRRGAGCRSRGGAWHPADSDEPGGSSKLYRHLWDTPRCKPPSSSYSLSLDAALRAQAPSPPPAPEHGRAHRGEKGRRGEANRGRKRDGAARKARAGGLRGRPVVRRGGEPAAGQWHCVSIGGEWSTDKNRGERGGGDVG